MASNISVVAAIEDIRAVARVAGKGQLVNQSAVEEILNDVIDTLETELRAEEVID